MYTFNVSDNMKIGNQIRTLLFEHANLGVNEIIPARNLQLNVFDEYAACAKRIYVHITGMSRKPLHRQTIKRRPDGPWQRFKKRRFPGWLLKLFPVKEVIVEVNSQWTWVCPHLVVEPRDKHLFWMMQELDTDAKAE